MCREVEYDSGLRTNTRFLTKELAYFLGGIYTANESVRCDSGQIYWAVPVRYNSNQASQGQVMEHYDFVRRIAESVGGYTVSQENLEEPLTCFYSNGPRGFVTIFLSTGLSNLSEGIEDLVRTLQESSESVKRAFILGAIDGRGTPDLSIHKQTLRYISTDCENEHVGVLLSRFFSDCGYDCNYNPPRDRDSGGRPRKSQFRIKAHSIENYMRDIGYISPSRFLKMEQFYDAAYGSHIVAHNDAFLPGVKTLTR